MNSEQEKNKSDTIYTEVSRLSRVEILAYLNSLNIAKIKSIKFVLKKGPAYSSSSITNEFNKLQKYWLIFKVAEEDYGEMYLEVKKFYQMMRSKRHGSGKTPYIYVLGFNFSTKKFSFINNRKALWRGSLINPEKGYITLISNKS